MTGIVLTSATSSVLRQLSVLSASIRLSTNISLTMAFKLVHASINNFFDRVPIGRILNRFMRDLSQIDWDLAYSTLYLLQVLVNCLVDFAASVYAASPIMALFFAAYFYASFKIQRFYMKSLREFTRLKAISTSPMIQAFSEGLQGGCTLRVFGKEAHALAQYIRALDQFQRNNITLEALYRWFGIRLTLLSTLILVPSILLNVLLVKSGPGIFALLMRYLLLVMQDISELLDTLSYQEGLMVSLERCSFFAEIKPEKGYKGLDIYQETFFKNKRQLKTTKIWPTQGVMVIENLKVKYRPTLDYVLKGVSLKIPHGSKVGIVGRTGAGKTTFISCLYRNFDDYEGDIFLDGLELRQVDLKELRSGITVIPQDPYLFHDTLKKNLDPMGQKSQEEMIETMKTIGLWSKFEKDGLASEIDQSGSNLSQGEKQLVCIARALLFKKKLILLDEATANIDSKNEETIQTLLGEKFDDCTILMIAHRLNTVMVCDKILVLGDGQVLEYGDRQALMADSKSHFAEMLKKHNDVQASLA
jgi:ABC-type multidrug transport system fused ATPase/permease subunit